MITLPQPSLALNAVDPWDKEYSVPKPRYRMEYTRNIHSDVSAVETLEYVAHIASLTDAGRLKCLVINCHGDPFSETQGGRRLLLGTGIDASNANTFRRIKGLVDDIYLVACRFGQNRALCSTIAQFAEACVYAATELQVGTRWQAVFNPPKNQIDNFEGDVYLFNREGRYVFSSLTKSHRK